MATQFAWTNEVVDLRGFAFSIWTLAASGGPTFVFHHGIGSSSQTFALLAQRLHELIPECGVIAFDARFHGATKSIDTARPNFAIEDMAADFEAILAHYDPPQIVLVGHSMGGNVVSRIACKLKQVKGLVVLDAVEGYAVQSLSSMSRLVRQWPTSFLSPQDAVDWSLKQLLHNRESAEISIPATLKQENGRYVFVVDLLATSAYWDGWFQGLDKSFLSSPASRLLVLAGTGRLDKDLIVGQMQGKYQLVVLNESGHFIQEDVPNKVALTLKEFWDRNSALPANIIPKFGSFR